MNAENINSQNSGSLQKNDIIEDNFDVLCHDDVGDLCEFIFGIRIGQKLICHNCKTIHIAPSDPIKFNIICPNCGNIARNEGL